MMERVAMVVAVLSTTVGLAGGADLADLCRLDNRETFFFSSENPKGLRSGGNAKQNCKESASTFLPPGQTLVLADIDGPGRIESIWIGGRGERLVLRMYWDGCEKPAVEATLAAFFGNGFPDNHGTVEGKYICLNSALMLTSPHTGRNCYIPMPFRRHAKITVENTQKKGESVYYAITGSRGPEGDDIGYFHAQYREAHPVKKGEPYVVLDGVKGRGRFIGLTLAAGANGSERCWVEGEIRMYLDGEATPTVHYTGTEDYFCGSYAFGNDAVLRKYQIYSGLYAGMYGIFGEHGGTGDKQHRFLLYRWHVKDPIRFTKGFRMTMDDLNMPGNRPRADDFATVAYWYETRSAPDKASVRLDISGETARQTVIAEGGRSLSDGYQGHPTTVLTREGKLICVWTLGHGGPCGPVAESTDGGRTWMRIDDRFPKVYRETHKNCPTLQKCVCRDGHERLFVFSAKRRDPTKLKGGCETFSWNAPLGIMISDDGGRTWREGTPAEVSSNMPPTGFMRLTDGSLALFGQVRLDQAVKTDRPQDDQGVWMSVSRDDGETWSPMRIVARAEARNLCEPFCLRSPDGKTLALLVRENRHRDCSMMCFSSDEGKTWTKPVLTAPELTGDRHEGVTLDDGRYLICFRDQMKNSPTAGQYVGWVGSWDDIVNARAGDLRIRLLNHHGKHGVWPGNEWDTGYSGVEKLADGMILCTTYTKHFGDDRHSSVVATRLYPSDFKKEPRR